MAARADISVVIPCFDTPAPWLRETLESLAAQTLAPRGILIVDDGSTRRETLELLETLRAPARVLRQPNQGPGPSRNAGVRAAQGELVLTLDADDRLRADALETLARLLLETPRAAFAYSQIQTFGGRDELHHIPPFNGYIQLGENFGVSCALFRRAALLEHQLEWPAMRGYEDWSFWISCAERGLEGAVSDEPLFLYRVKPTSGVNAAADRIRESLRAEIERGHPKAFGAEGRARIKQRWAPGVELIWLGPDEERARLREAVERQSLNDVIVSPKPTGGARALLAEARGKYLSLVRPADLARLEAEPALLEQLARRAEAHPFAAAIDDRGGPGIATGKRAHEPGGRAPGGLLLLRTWALALGLPAAVPLEEVEARALSLPSGAPPPRSLPARSISAARSLIARVLGLPLAAALLPFWSPPHAQPMAAPALQLPVSRSTELMLRDGLPVRFDRVATVPAAVRLR